MVSSSIDAAEESAAHPKWGHCGLVVGAANSEDRGHIITCGSRTTWTRTTTRISSGSFSSTSSSSSSSSFSASNDATTAESPTFLSHSSTRGGAQKGHENVPSSVGSPTTLDTTATLSSSSARTASASSVLSDTPRSVGQESFLSSFSAFPSSMSDSAPTSSSRAPSSGTTVRVPLPSPSRPRIHPGYAARRLTPRPAVRQPRAGTHQLHSPPTPTASPASASRPPSPPRRGAGEAMSSEASVASMHVDDEMESEESPPPSSLAESPARLSPGSGRGQSLYGAATRSGAAFSFRPTPIVTCETPRFDDIDCDDDDNHNGNDVSLLEDDSVDFRTARTSLTSSTSTPRGAPTAPLPSAGCGGGFNGGTARIFSMTTSAAASASTSNRRVPKRNDSSLDVGVSDRYIPSRATSSFSFNMWDGMATPTSSSSSSTPRPLSNDMAGSSSGTPAEASSTRSTPPDTAAAADLDEPEENGYHPTTTGSASQQGLLNTLLRSELLGENDVPPSSAHSHAGRFQPTHGAASSNPSSGTAPLRDGANCLRYVSPRQMYQDGVSMLHGGDAGAANRSMVHPTSIVNSFSLSALGSATSQRLMSAPPKRKRRISKVPFKVLDAPSLQDDFYLNLVDWSSQNVLAVGLGSCVYLWSACTSKVTKLCDLASAEDVVTAVAWAQRGTHLSVGTNRGEVQLWDTVHCTMVRSMAGHSARVGTLAWSGPLLASGSRDRLIYLRDVRAESAFTDTLSNHKQEVCGLKWSYDEPAFLASGGNDNHLHVIDPRNTQAPIFEFSDHTAAVKAIAWSPHQHGLLASGGGTADRCIRFWNTLSGTSLNKIDTGSQVCNLAWSQNCNELVSTHGYSLNQIVIWRYPSMTKVTTLTGHAYRVLYLSMSPDGSTIVTGAGDETLRFWQVFPGPRADGKESSSSLLFPRTLGSVIR